MAADRPRQGRSTPAWSSASSATRARARRWTRPSATTSRRPRRCRCRSRCSSWSWPSARSSPPACPLLLALSAVMATLGLVAIPSHFIPMDDTISSIVLLIGMAVGVDYTLFYLRREREERRRGATGRQAIDTAAATSGRAVLISGFTVIAAMAGMFLAGDQTFTSLGVGSILVVAVAMIGSLTVVPAVLAALGDKVDKGRIPLLHRVVGRGDGSSRVWDAILGARSAPPGGSPRVAAVTLLVVLALPALGMHTVQTGHRRPPAQARGHAGLRPDAGRVPRRADPGDRRGHRPGRHDPAGPGRDPRPRAPGRRDGHDERPGRRDRSAPTTGSPRCRPADEGRRDRRRCRCAPWTRCATTSCRAPWAGVDGTEAFVSGMAAETKDWNSLMSPRGCRSCSASSWPSPSCCCS